MICNNESEAAAVSPIVPYKFYVVPLVAFLNAVNTDGVPICCITGVTPAETKDKMKWLNMRLTWVFLTSANLAGI